MLPNRILFSIQGGLDFALPKMARVRQLFPRSDLSDVCAETRRTIEALNLGDLGGKHIALTAGSRKITNLPEILRTTAEYLRTLGAIPFVVPAMGSHGGATAEGQVTLLRELGITEESVGIPIRSSMDVVQIATTEGNHPVFCDKLAAEADGIVVCGRIKPHTSINGEIESGLCKMMIVGLGKHRGATSFHRQGYHRLAQILPADAEAFLKNANILFGLGIVEDAADQTLKIEAIRPGELIEREKSLLAYAKRMMPRLLLSEIDVLIVDRIGKDISGAGMDPNVTGRSITPLPVKIDTDIKSIVVLDITDASHGNATGIGGADITTKRAVEKIDFAAMYTNVFTSGALGAARIPVVLDTDEEAIRVAMKCIPKGNIRDVRIVRIKDTLHLTDIEVSENYLPEISDDSRFAIKTLGMDLRFDESRTLLD